MSSVAWLEPDNVDDALLNWAAWANQPASDIGELSEDGPVSFKYAVAVDDLFGHLHYREKNALKVAYLNKRMFVTEAALYTAKQAVEQGLKQRKLLT